MTTQKGELINTYGDFEVRDYKVSSTHYYIWCDSIWISRISAENNNIDTVINEVEKWIRGRTMALVNYLKQSISLREKVERTRLFITDQQKIHFEVTEVKPYYIGPFLIKPRGNRTYGVSIKDDLMIHKDLHTRLDDFKPVDEFSMATFKAFLTNWVNFIDSYEKEDDKNNLELKVQIAKITIAYSELKLTATD